MNALEAQTVQTLDQLWAEHVDIYMKNPGPVAAIQVVLNLYGKTKDWSVFDALPDVYREYIITLLDVAIGDVLLRAYQKQNEQAEVEQTDE